MPTHARAERPHARKKHALTRGQGIAVAIIIGAFALGLAGYAAAASYASVSNLAASRHVPLARYCPIGIDGGLLAVIVFDIALTWIRKPIGGLRLAARMFAAGTIAANAAAGWPDPVSVSLRIAAPALFVIIVEAGRAVLLNRGREASARIPLTRWLLAPRSTFTIWRRKKLWADARLPQAAIDAELAIVQLHAFYGETWQEKAPADLVWMIRAGVNMDQVLERVAELTAPPKAETPVAKSAPKARTRKRGSAQREDLTTELRALKLLDDEPGLRQPRMGGELARKLGVSPATGRRLHARLTAQRESAEPLAERSEGQSDERSGERS